MELYTSVCYELSERLTKRYSTSFSLSSRLFDGSIRRHIYAIYGLVRIADEIVDTYRGSDSLERLNNLEAEVARAMEAQYSANPIVHAYAQTARRFAIDSSLLMAFFESMRMDIDKQSFTKKQYDEYIYGSAEVIGLMCARVFVQGEKQSYESLQTGARALGSAYQKVNFLRDMKSDYEERGRVYFPRVDFDSFSETHKRAIEEDIEADFAVARQAIDDLPRVAIKAVRASYYYYYALFEDLKHADAETIKTRRLRVSSARKMALLAKAAV